MDWGETDDWEVDKKAERLNKDLFGKPNKGKGSAIKADANLEDTSQFNGDSDDNDNEKLSKKAKKKLKERKRKENKRNKHAASNEINGQSKNVENVNLDKDKDESDSKGELVSVKKETKSNKKKVKSKTAQSLTKTVEKSSANDTGEEVKEKAKMKKSRKRKISGEGDKEEEESKTVKIKQKISKDGEKEESGEEVKKKRKRQKKKKPNSKKNKYKHLGLKSKIPGVDETIDSDLKAKDETVKNSEKDFISEEVVILNGGGNGVKKIWTRKRQRSASPEKSKTKKTKLLNGSEETQEQQNEQKKKKKQEYKGTSKEMVEKKDVPADNKASKKSKKDRKSKTDSGNENSVENHDVTEKEIMESVNNSTGDKEMKSKGEKNSKKGKKKDGNDTKKTEVKPLVSPFFTSSQGSELQQKVTDKLASARFRFINEQLYTIKGGEAFRMFQQDKTLMEAYNTGFQGQAKQWSVNPLDVIIKQIAAKPPNSVVADFGCGEARLSASVKLKVHSLDLYALNKRVTVCDMSKTPLVSGSVDIAVFCLSLMGTNLNDYLVEANRVLKEGGLLKIAEVVSRFTNVNHFIKAVTAVGFKPVNTRELSTMFYLMDFKKVKNVEKLSKHVAPISLKPCVYKKR